MTQAATPELLAVTQADVTFANHIIARFRQISKTEWYADAHAEHWLAKDIARHRLASASAPAGWRTIESAPRQIEYRCLLAHEFSVVIGYWDGDGWRNERSRADSYFQATHWMPIIPLTAAPQPPVVGCAASPDHADIMETTQNASDDWQKNGYTSALAEVRDMANVGRALMEALPEGYSYMNCPSEIVSDLQNERDDALAAQPSTLSDHLQTLRFELNDVARSGDYVEGAQDMLDKVAGLRVTLPAEERMRGALSDLLSWFDGGPHRSGPWIIESGEFGVDDAVTAARAALKESRDDR